MALFFIGSPLYAIATQHHQQVPNVKLVHGSRARADLASDRLYEAGSSSSGRDSSTWLANTTQSASRSFLFMGGLQRSGTTWLESLVTSSQLSSLSFDNVNLSAYMLQRPWRLQNHTQAYFESVVRVGGVEGKFIQGVYPYVYFVRDVGKDGRTLDSLVLSPSSASPESGAKLFSEWSLFWDTSRALLLEKTPENFLMGLFLQAAFGQSSTRFAFVIGILCLGPCHREMDIPRFRGSAYSRRAHCLLV